MISGGAGKLLQHIAGPFLLGLAVYVASAYAFSVSIGPDGLPSVMLANGIAIALLIRSEARAWPALIVAAVLAQAAAIIHIQQMGPASAAVRSVASAGEFVLCAWLVRRRIGPYFDLADYSHLAWFAMFATLGMAVRLAILAMLLPVAFPLLELTADRALTWVAAEYLGQFVLSLPLLAISARAMPGFAGFDRYAIGLLMLLAGSYYAVFGPIAFPGVYVIMLPLMMLAAWRHGLRGAGLATLLTITVSAACTYFGMGPFVRFRVLGYNDAQLGIYFELLFILSLLACLPLSVGRARQIAMSTRLKEALAAAEERAEQLAASESIARRTAAEAVEVQDALAERMKELNCVYRVLEVTFDRRIEEAQVYRQIVEIVPPSMQHPANAVARIRSGQDEFRSRNWREPTAKLSRSVVSEGREIGEIEIGYVDLDEAGRDIFLIEEEAMLDAVASRIGKMVDERRMSRRLSEAERMSAIGELTGGIAHDFNNLLTVIVGSSATLAKDLTDPAQKKLASLSLQAARQGADLTRQLLAFSRRQVLEPQPIDISALVEDNAPLIERALGERLRFKIETAPGLPLAFVDPAHTESAILNLSINARDAMPDGGSLTIETAFARLPERLVRRDPQARQGDFVVVHVRDTGTGIAPEVVDKIFEPFFTTKAAGKGSGLGLSMVYGFIQQSGGYMDLETELGVGTTFSLYLPLAAEGAARAEKGSERPIEGGDENILVVEDHALVRAGVTSQLERLGYSVVEATDAEQALAILADRDDVDLLFTDILMPGEMNGRELGEAATSRQPSLRVLYTSGFSRDVLHDEGRLMEGVNLLSKPYSAEDLAEKVREVLDEIPS